MISQIKGQREFLLGTDMDTDQAIRFNQAVIKRPIQRHGTASKLDFQQQLSQQIQLDYGGEQQQMINKSMTQIRTAQGGGGGQQYKTANVLPELKSMRFQDFVKAQQRDEQHSIQQQLQQQQQYEGIEQYSRVDKAYNSGRSDSGVAYLGEPNVQSKVSLQKQKIANQVVGMKNYRNGEEEYEEEEVDGGGDQYDSLVSFNKSKTALPIQNNDYQQANDQIVEATKMLNGHSQLTEPFLGPSSQVRKMKMRLQNAQQQSNFGQDKKFHRKLSYQKSPASYMSLDSKKVSGESDGHDYVIGQGTIEAATSTIQNSTNDPTLLQIAMKRPTVQILKKHSRAPRQNTFKSSNQQQWETATLYHNQKRTQYISPTAAMAINSNHNICTISSESSYNKRNIMQIQRSPKQRFQKQAKTATGFYHLENQQLKSTSSQNRQPQNSMVMDYYLMSPISQKKNQQNEATLQYQKAQTFSNAKDSYQFKVVVSGGLQQKEQPTESMIKSTLIEQPKSILRGSEDTSDNYSRSNNNNANNMPALLNLESLPTLKPQSTIGSSKIQDDQSNKDILDLIMVGGVCPYMVQPSSEKTDQQQLFNLSRMQQNGQQKTGGDYYPSPKKRVTLISHDSSGSSQEKIRQEDLMEDFVAMQQYGDMITDTNQQYSGQMAKRQTNSAQIVVRQNIPVDAARYDSQSKTNTLRDPSYRSGFQIATDVPSTVQGEDGVSKVSTKKELLNDKKEVMKLVSPKLGHVNYQQKLPSLQITGYKSTLQSHQKHDSTDKKTVTKSYKDNLIISVAPLLKTTPRKSKEELELIQKKEVFQAAKQHVSSTTMEGDHVLLSKIYNISQSIKGGNDDQQENLATDSLLFIQGTQADGNGVMIPTSSIVTLKEKDTEAVILEELQKQELDKHSANDKSENYVPTQVASVTEIPEMKGQISPVNIMNQYEHSSGGLKIKQFNSNSKSQVRVNSLLEIDNCKQGSGNKVIKSVQQQLQQAADQSNTVTIQHKSHKSPEGSIAEYTDKYSNQNNGSKIIQPEFSGVRKSFGENSIHTELLSRFSMQGSTKNNRIKKIDQNYVNLGIGNNKQEDLNRKNSNQDLITSLQMNDLKVTSVVAEQKPTSQERTRNYPPVQKSLRTKITTNIGNPSTQKMERAPHLVTIKQMQPITTSNKNTNQMVSAYKLPNFREKGEFLPAFQKDIMEGQTASFKNLTQLFREKQKQKLYEQSAKAAQQILNNVGQSTPVNENECLPIIVPTDSDARIPIGDARIPTDDVAFRTEDLNYLEIINLDLKEQRRSISQDNTDYVDTNNLDPEESQFGAAPIHLLYQNSSNSNNALDHTDVASKSLFQPPNLKNKKTKQTRQNKKLQILQNMKNEIQLKAEKSSMMHLQTHGINDNYQSKTIEQIGREFKILGQSQANFNQNQYQPSTSNHEQLKKYITDSKSSTVIKQDSIISGGVKITYHPGRSSPFAQSDKSYQQLVNISNTMLQSTSHNGGSSQNLKRKQSLKPQPKPLPIIIPVAGLKNERFNLVQHQNQKKSRADVQKPINLSIASHLTNNSQISHTHTQIDEYSQHNNSISQHNSSSFIGEPKIAVLKQGLNLTQAMPSRRTDYENMNSTDHQQRQESIRYNHSLSDQTSQIHQDDDQKKSQQHRQNTTTGKVKMIKPYQAIGVFSSTHKSNFQGDANIGNNVRVQVVRGSRVHAKLSQPGVLSSSAGRIESHRSSSQTQVKLKPLQNIKHIINSKKSSQQYDNLLVNTKKQSIPINRIPIMIVDSSQQLASQKQLRSLRQRQITFGKKQRTHLAHKLLV